MHRYRILVLTTDGLSSIRSWLQERLVNVDVVEATTPNTLRDALVERGYDLSCIETPLSWVSMDDVIQTLRDELPTCPLVPFTRNEMQQLMSLLADIADIGLQQTT